jgi:hypothetical protein
VPVMTRCRPVNRAGSIIARMSNLVESVGAQAEIDGQSHALPRSSRDKRERSSAANLRGGRLNEDYVFIVALN